MSLDQDPAYNDEHSKLLAFCPVVNGEVIEGKLIERSIDPSLLRTFPFGDKLASILHFHGNRPYVIGITEVIKHGDFIHDKSELGFIHDTLVKLHNSGVYGVGISTRSEATLLNMCFTGLWPRLNLEDLTQSDPILFFESFLHPDEETGGIVSATSYASAGLVAYIKPSLITLRNHNNTIISRFNEGKGTNISYIPPENLIFLVRTEKDRLGFLSKISEVINRMYPNSELDDLNSSVNLDYTLLKERIRSCEGIATLGVTI